MTHIMSTTGPGRNTPTSGVPEPRRSTAYAAGKRLMDVLLVLLAAPAVLLISLPIALMIRLDSPGPVLYRTTRLTRKMRPFTVYKFRSMTRDAESQLPRIQHLNIMGGPSFKAPQDPRVTRFGRLLRGSSLDELPQLWNVIRGDMSLVGPRPVHYRDFDGQEDILARRCEVKPGLTGLWQVNGRSTLGHGRMVELDLEYVEHCSLQMDMLLLLKTVPVVLRGIGAV